MMKPTHQDEILLTRDQVRILLSLRALHVGQLKVIARQTCFSAMEIREIANKEVEESARLNLVQCLVIIRQLRSKELFEECTGGFTLTSAGHALKLQMEKQAA